MNMIDKQAMEERIHIESAQLRITIGSTFESGVTQRENVKGVQTHESVMHGSTMTRHNTRTINVFEHVSGFSIQFYDDATKYEIARNVLDTYLR